MSPEKCIFGYLYHSSTILLEHYLSIFHKKTHSSLRYMVHRYYKRSAVLRHCNILSVAEQGPDSVCSQEQQSTKNANRRRACGSHSPVYNRNHITGDPELTDVQVLIITELLDEMSPKGVFKEFNSEIRKSLKAAK